MRTRKLLLSLLFFPLLLLLNGCSPDAIDSYGHPIRISNYRGKWVVINYWATWCSPCIQEIPDLNKLAEYYKDKVVVLGVTIDNLNNAALQGLAQGYQVKYPFLRYFPIEKWGGKPNTVPITYILSPKGRLYKTLVGPQKLINFQSIMQLPPITYQ
jgi:thiol-disulfide isomerase/thioredoxin